MSTIALQNLLDYLVSTLTLSNRQWLAAHLIDSIQNENTAKQRTKEETYVRESLSRAFNEVQSSQNIEAGKQTIDSFLTELKSEDK